MWRISRCVIIGGKKKKWSLPLITDENAQGSLIPFSCIKDKCVTLTVLPLSWKICTEAAVWQVTVPSVTGWRSSQGRKGSFQGRHCIWQYHGLNPTLHTACTHHVALWWDWVFSPCSLFYSHLFDESSSTTFTETLSINNLS